MAVRLRTLFNRLVQCLSRGAVKQEDQDSRATADVPPPGFAASVACETSGLASCRHSFVTKSPNGRLDELHTLGAAPHWPQGQPWRQARPREDCRIRPSVTPATPAPHPLRYQARPARLPAVTIGRLAVNCQFGMPFDEHGSVLGQALPGGRHSDPADHRQRRDRANAETDDGLEETNLVHG